MYFTDNAVTYCPVTQKRELIPIHYINLQNKVILPHVALRPLLLPKTKAL